GDAGGGAVATPGERSVRYTDKSRRWRNRQGVSASLKRWFVKCRIKSLRLSRGLQLAGNPAGRDRIHRVLDDRVCEAVVAVSALKCAELKAPRVGRTPHQHHAASAFRTSWPSDRKQARFGTRIWLWHD